MNGKVKVHVVDGSKCVLHCRSDKEEPRPRSLSLIGCSGVSSGFLTETKLEFGEQKQVESPQ